MKKYLMLFIAAFFAVIPTYAQTEATLNQGDPCTFTVTVAGSQPFTYQWFKGGTPISGATVNPYRIPSVVLADAGSYTVKVSNSVGDTTSPAALLNVKLIAPAVSGISPTFAALNPGEPATITVSATGSGPFTYQWFKGGVAIPGASANPFRIASVAQGDAGSYTVTVTNSAGASTSPPAELRVRNPPTVTGITIEKK